MNDRFFRRCLFAIAFTMLADNLFVNCGGKRAFIDPSEEEEAPAVESHDMDAEYEDDHHTLIEECSSMTLEEAIKTFNSEASDSHLASPALPTPSGSHSTNTEAVLARCDFDAEVHASSVKTKGRAKSSIADSKDL